MKRKLFALLIAVALIVSLSVTAYAAFSAESRNSVVVVSTCMDTQYGEFSFGTGTGFFINDQYLVTNHHVIDTFEQYGSGEMKDITVNDTPTSGRAKIRVYFGTDDYEEAYIVGSSKTKDVAILKLDKPTTKRTPLEIRIPDDSIVGSSVYVIGFPGPADNIFADSTESWGVSDSTVTSGTVSRILTTSGTGQQLVQIDCDIKPGNSGGPVVDDNGAVIGIATMTVKNTDKDSVNYAVNIQEAVALMNQYVVDYTIYGNAVQEEAPGETQPAAPEKQSNIALLVAIAVAAVAVIAVIVLLVVRKKPAPAPIPAPAPVPGPAPKVPVVRSLARENYGANIRLAGQSVMIGRSGDCALKFPSNAPGVSGCHCTIQWDAAGKCFVVTDLRSTYGTFLMTGQKMQPNVPYRLRAGDKFYLGDQNNTLSLELE